MEITGKSVPPSLTTHRSLVPSSGLPGTICVTVPLLPLYLPAVTVTLEPPVIFPAAAPLPAFLAGAALGSAGLAARALASADALTAARFSSRPLGLGAALGAAWLGLGVGVRGSVRSRARGRARVRVWVIARLGRGFGAAFCRG